MQRNHARERELALLLRRHNKNAKIKLKSAEITIPEFILDILCQKAARNSSQNEIIECFREKAINELFALSKHIQEERIKKAKQTRESNLEKDPRYIKHFGVWINSALPNARISREHYAIIDRKCTHCSPKYSKYLAEQGKDNLVLDETGERGIYTEEWCIAHRDICMRNFDINMERFASLSSEEFEIVLHRFVKGRRFHEIVTLDDPICTETPYSANLDGYVYLMVFDAYKQAYIGITRRSIKQRITQHWQNQRAFDRLIFGSVENSVLSIDSFGPLDTTRIFVLPYGKERKTRIERYEEICIKAFDQNYLLNRLL